MNHLSRFNKIAGYLLMAAVIGFSQYGFSASDNYHMLVRHYDIRLKVMPANKTIEGLNTIRFQMTTTSDFISLDLAPRLRIDSIVWDKRKVSYKRKGKKVKVMLGHTLAEGQIATINVYYSGAPEVAIKAPWQGGFVWSADKHGKPWIGLACESKGASLWLPCRDKWDNEVDSLKIELMVPDSLVGVSNGQLTKVIYWHNGHRSFLWKVVNPINHYNISVNVGDYSHFMYFSGTTHRLKTDYYVLRDNLSRAKVHFNEVDSMLLAFEHYFGPYPFYEDGYKLVETPYWGMEHQSCVAYGNHYKYNSYGFDFIIVHESGHEWFANSLTASDPCDMWIHESFTTYSEALYVNYWQGKERMLSYLNGQKPLIKAKRKMLGPPGVDFHGWKDNDVYYKGTWMLHTLRSHIGNDSLFFAAIRRFAVENRHSLLKTQEVIDLFSRYLGQDLNPFFKQYLSHPAIPELEFEQQSANNGKVIYRYRLKGSESGFKLRIELPGTRLPILEAGENWQEVELTSEMSEALKKVENYYLVKLDID